MKKNLLLPIVLILLAISCRTRPDMTNPASYDLFPGLQNTGSYAAISDRGAVAFYCGNEYNHLNGGKQLRSNAFKTELLNKWKFVRLTKSDTSSELRQIGNTTASFNLSGYDSLNHQTWTIGVFSDLEHVYGIYHSVYGAMKPVTQESGCYYLSALTW